jgi:coatomer subunit beta
VSKLLLKRPYRPQKTAAEKRELEATNEKIIQVDDLLSFRQFSKKAADDVIDVSAHLDI